MKKKQTKKDIKQFVKNRARRRNLAFTLSKGFTPPPLSKGFTPPPFDPAEEAMVTMVGRLLGSLMRPAIRKFLDNPPPPAKLLCDCDCHVLGTQGGTLCPPECSSHKLDGCHRCGCPGTTCLVGECKVIAPTPPNH